MTLDAAFKDLTELPEVHRARELIRASDPLTLADMVEVVQIAAPPFGEGPRAEWIAERFRAVGLVDVAMDEAGNVLARLPAAEAAAGPSPVLLAAHLDTVFPEETELTVRREGDRLFAPGVADNARGLAAMLAIARVLVATGPVPARPLVCVATVGEEGAGDLRGVKHLFREGSPWREAGAFLTLDGTGLRRIVHRALGSVRLRVTVTGPGGHSWADWGVVNPIHILGVAVAELARQKSSRQPRTSLTVARTGGGTSINAIPSEAWIELDLRSESGAALADARDRVLRVIRGAAAELNGRRRRGTPAASVRVDTIGERPGGETPVASPIVRIAQAATRWIGETPELAASSTDANVPIALGIPAIALGAGGESGGTHTTGEWYLNDGGPEGIERALLAVLGLTGVADGSGHG